MTNILHTFLSPVSARTLDRPDGIKRMFGLLSSSITHRVPLAREDMPNKLLILNNLRESLQWLSDHMDTSGMS